MKRDCALYKVEANELLFHHHWRELLAGEKVKEGEERMLLDLGLDFHVEKVFFVCLLLFFIFIAIVRN